MIGIINYGMGNLKSVTNAFASLGFESFIASRPDELEHADRVVLPGVGAFKLAIAEIRRGGWDVGVRESIVSGKPLIGICLGMHLLFEKSLENGVHSGLGIFPGIVELIPNKTLPGGKKLKIPQMGWNRLEMRKESAILPQSGDAYVYFVHSYYAAASPGHVTAVTDYGSEITAAVESGSVFGVQFHPEKSGEQGLGILKRFAEVPAGR